MQVKEALDLGMKPDQAKTEHCVLLPDLRKNSSVIKGRVVNFRDYGKVLFIDVQWISNDSKKVVQYVLNQMQHQDKYETLKRSIFKGACIQIHKFKEELNHNERKQNILYDFKIINKPDRFPKQFQEKITNRQLLRKEPVLAQIINESYHQRVLKRIKIIKSVRDFFYSKNALEIDLPILEEKYGGALAKPFKTQANYNKKTYYLRVSQEFPCQKMIISGVEKMFTLGSCFRNESLDHTHTFEHINLEYYSTSETINEGPALLEELFHLCYSKIEGSSTYENFDLKKSWPRYGAKEIETLKKKHSLEHLSNLEAAKKLGDLKLLGPLYHLIDLEPSPLAKGPTIESFARYNLEIGTMYQQQIDPKTITDNLLKLNPKIENGEALTAQDLIDPAFLKDLQLGMHETFGFGLGLERLVQVVCGCKDIRDTQIHPKI